MPLATIYLLKLSHNASVPQYINLISSNGVRPIITSRAVRWIIRPERKSSQRLIGESWDLLIITSTSKPLPEACLTADWISNHWSITAGIPNRLLTGFEERNRRLLHPKVGDVPPLTGALDSAHMAETSQGLELSDELQAWAKGFTLGQDKAVSMLNLLAFQEGEEAHASYQRYGAAFADGIGSRRGGLAKIVGKVVPGRETKGQETKGEEVDGWDEIALAHYPSIRHFLDMLAGEDYQLVNHRDRLPALRDTCILCTSELSPDLVSDKAHL